jgi:hypothetical protein
MNVRMRQVMECQIALTAIRSILAAGYSITVSDGEEEVLKRSRDPKAIAEAMMSTDEDVLKFYETEHPQSKQAGWVHLVYGNSGHDVISDHTANEKTEGCLKEANLLADQLSEAEHYSDASKVMVEVFSTFSFPK